MTRERHLLALFQQCQLRLPPKVPAWPLLRGRPLSLGGEGRAEVRSGAEERRATNASRRQSRRSGARRPIEKTNWSIRSLLRAAQGAPPHFFPWNPSSTAVTEVSGREGRSPRPVTATRGECCKGELSKAKKSKTLKLEKTLKKSSASAAPPLLAATSCVRGGSLSAPLAGRERLQ